MMGKTYIVTPGYTTRAPPYPWKHLIAALPEPYVNDSQKLVANPPENDAQQTEDAAIENQVALDHEADLNSEEPTETGTAIPSTSTGVAEDVEAAAQSTTVSPALFLGDILRDPLGDELIPLNRKDRKNIPTADIFNPDIKQGFCATRGELLSGRLGIWASMFAALGLPVGIETGLIFKRHTQDVLSVNTLVTFEFEAQQAFVDDSIKLASIQSYLAGYDREAPPALYMITGLRVAYGASLKKTSSVDGGGALGLQLRGADAQKILEFKKARNKGENFNNSAPFVLAFRVRKILYKKGRWEHKLSKKGASMMDGEKNIAEPKVGASGLGEDYTVDDILDEGEDYGSVQDGDDKWLFPGYI